MTGDFMSELAVQPDQAVAIIIRSRHGEVLVVPPHDAEGFSTCFPAPEYVSAARLGATMFRRPCGTGIIAPLECQQH
jgi:hypothetical protein